jgi:hypothetical protein
MLKTIVVIAALIVASAVFQLSGNEAKRLGVDRSPERNLFYRIETYTAPTGNYAVPVLFPLDLVLMLVVSGALALASVTWGPALRRLCDRLRCASHRLPGLRPA